MPYYKVIEAHFWEGFKKAIHIKALMERRKSGFSAVLATAARRCGAAAIDQKHLSLNAPPISTRVCRSRQNALQAPVSLINAILLSSAR